MNHKKISEVDADGRCFHEFEVHSKGTITLATNHVDVTSSNDGPFLGKIYNRVDDTWSDPPEESSQPISRKPAGQSRRITDG